MSQPNNNHNPNIKTTITAVGLMRLSNRWEYHPHHHTNSRLHDRAEIEQNSETKVINLGDPKTVFEPYSNSKNSPLGPQKVKNDPKIKSNSKVRIERNKENESCSTI